jgi:hypothetical protein
MVEQGLEGVLLNHQNLYKLVQLRACTMHNVHNMYNGRNLVGSAVSYTKSGRTENSESGMTFRSRV